MPGATPGGTTKTLPKDPEPDLAQDEWIHSELALVLAQPLEHARLRRGFRGLAEDVRIDEEPHSVSVDSD